MTEGAMPAAGVDRTRYRRVVRVFARAFGHFILWEIILRRILGRGFVERSAQKRWKRIARDYRAMALELGGVLIKLGQFLSIRVDLLPEAVTAELAGLQDEVPPERLADIVAVIESEYGQPVSGVFSWFSPEPEAAASLAQVHRARLLTGVDVVVKIQRPGIGSVVDTDLEAIRTASVWLKRYRPIRRRVDLDRLYDEFSRTTRTELDFLAEGEHAERFARDFAQDPGVRIPRIYPETSTRRVLIMEDVANIKISDFAAIEAAGISRKDVARRLFDTYLRQFFIHNFVHADPHPGNLFVEPLGRPAVQGRLPRQWSGDSDEMADDLQGRSFRLVFVDFGMVATVPQHQRQHFRDYLLGFASRDSSRMVRAYQGAGVLLPGADLERLEQAEAELLDRYWGLTLGQAQQVIMNDWKGLAREYRDILYEMPFQLPTELLFIGRTMAILFGMATSLDPDFDPWAAIAPFAEEVAATEVKRDWRELLRELEKVIRLLLVLPGQADRFYSQAGRGELTVRSPWSPEDRRMMKRVEIAARRLATAVVFAALLLAGVAVHVTQGGGAGSVVLFALAGVALVVMLTQK